MTEPAHGTVVEGDPAAARLRVAGTYAEAGAVLAIQVLADPGDLTSWETVATARATAPAGEVFGFAEELPSIPADRWPAGGVVRLRVVDDAGAPLAVETVADPADDGVVALANPAEPPASWTYLTRKPTGSIEETRAYYLSIDAPKTLADFRTRFGFDGSEPSATYYNAGDLGIGREMHCRGIAAGGVACYVRNFGVFGGDPAEALAQAVAGGVPLATVAMTFTPPASAPNAVQFMVYAANDKITLSARLDTHGDNISVPQNCLNCHGGRATYDPATHAVAGARFLPFDPGGFRFEGTLASQEGRLEALQQLVLATEPTEAIRELATGMFPATGFAPEFVPPGWNATPRDARVYREVVAPYCRTCHASFPGPNSDALTFASAEVVRARSGQMASAVCGAGPHGMPAAEVTSRGFFSSAARAVWLAWLGAAGACAP